MGINMNVLGKIELLKKEYKTWSSCYFFYTAFLKDTKHADILKVTCVVNIKLGYYGLILL